MATVRFAAAAACALSLLGGASAQAAAQIGGAPPQAVQTELCTISDLFGKVQVITTDAACRGGCATGTCPAEWMPTAADQCSPECGRVFEPFWDQCGEMLVQAHMGGMDEMGLFYDDCLEELYPPGSCGTFCNEHTYDCYLTEVHQACCDEEGTNCRVDSDVPNVCPVGCAIVFPEFLETCREHVAEHEATDPNIIVAEFEAFEQQCLTTDGLALVEYALQLVDRGCVLDLNGVPGGGHRLRRMQQFLRQRLSSSAEDCAWDALDDLAQGVTSICCGGGACPEGSLVPTSCSPGCAVALHQFTMSCGPTLLIIDQDYGQIMAFEESCLADADPLFFLTAIKNADCTHGETLPANQQLDPEPEPDPEPESIVNGDCNWQPVPTGLGDDFSVAAPASKAGRDIRSGNPHEVNTARLPDITTVVPPQRLSFSYEYVVGYGRWGRDVPDNVRGPTFTVGLVDAATGAETVVYTSDELSTYDYDTCNGGGMDCDCGRLDYTIVGDGCYSSPVDVDVPINGFDSTEFYVQFTFTNNDRNMHLNEDGMQMLVAACSAAAAAELDNPLVLASSTFCNDFTTPDHYGYIPFFMDTQLGPMKAVQFSVRASNDALVAFFDHDLTDAAWTGNGHEHYEIAISGWGNTQSVIRQSAQGANVAIADTPGFLSRSEDRNFWASALNGLVRLGTGPVVGHNLVMEWQDPDPINPQYAAVSTGWGSTGRWHICVVEGDVPAGNDDGVVEFHHSQGGDVRPSIVNGDFDLNPVSAESGFVFEAPTSWESGGSGIVMVQQSNGPWGGLSSGSGINYISIQGSGAYIEQTITGVTPGQAYEISFLCSSRPGYGDDETFNVQVDGNVIWETGHPPDSAFREESAIFTARTNTAVLRIENDSPAGDQSVLIDALTIAQMNLGAPLTMTNPSFEDDVLTEPYTYMTPTGWASSTTVVAQNGNAPWGGLSSAVGTNYLSIPGNGAYVEQTLRGLQSGVVYEVRFLAAKRPGYGGDESLTVKVDNIEVWESTHPADTFQVYRVAFTAQSLDGTAILRFENDSPAGDRSIFVDDISVMACLDCDLEPSAEPAFGGSSCQSNPCQNGGVCADASTDFSLKGDEYSCTCATNPMTGEPMHWGVNCETSEDDCTLVNDPCLAQPGTTCIDCARMIQPAGGFPQQNPDCPYGYTCADVG